MAFLDPWTIQTGTTAGTVAAGNDNRITGAEQTANKGVASGYCPLEGSSLVPAANMRTVTAVAAGTVVVPPASDLTVDGSGNLGSSLLPTAEISTSGITAGTFTLPAPRAGISPSRSSAPVSAATRPRWPVPWWSTCSSRIRPCPPAR